MSRRPPRQTAAFSLFTFLDVMLCTLGALIIVLICVVRTAQIKNSDVPPETAAEIEEIQGERETAEWRTKHLAASREQTRKQLQDRRLELSHIEEHTRRLRSQLAELDAAEKVLAAEHGPSPKLEQLQLEARRLAGMVEESERELNRARDEAQNKRPSYAVVPYDGPNQTRRRPMYIECRADRIILQPENIELTVEDFMGPLGPGNPLAAGLRAAREYLSSYQNTAVDDVEPYPLLLVRPDGVEGYYAAREAMTSWGSEFGYEFVDQDWKLEFRESPPAMIEAMRVAILEARLRQQALARAAPRYFTGKGQKWYHASSQGGVVPEGGVRDEDDDIRPGTGGRYARGGYAGRGGASPYAQRGAGGRPGGGYAGGQGRGASSDEYRGGSSSGGGGTENGGMSDQENPYLAVAQATTQGTGRGGVGGGGPGGLPGSAGSAGGLAAGPSGPPASIVPGGITKTYGNALGGAAGANANAASGGAAADGGPAIPGVNGNGTGGSGLGSLSSQGGSGGTDQNGTRGPEGSLSAAANGGFTGNSYGSGGVTSLNGAMEQSGGPAGSGRYGTAPGGAEGGSGDGQSGTFAAGGTSPSGTRATGNGAADSRGGKGRQGTAPGAAQTAEQQGAEGPGQANGRPGQTGAGKLGKQPGGQYADAGGQDSSTSGTAGGSSSSMGGGSAGASGAAPNMNISMGSPAGMSSQSGSASSSMADSRGKNWSLPEEARRAVPITRPVRVECQPDKIVLRSEQNPKLTKEIPLPGRTEDSVDDLVSSVWQRVDTWGQAGRGMYWHPYLSVDVAPGADGRYQDLQTLLADSGLDVKPAPKAPVQAARPKSKLLPW